MSVSNSTVMVQARLNAVVANVEGIAAREEQIARKLRMLVSKGDVPVHKVHRTRARADTLMKLAAELREAAGIETGKKKGKKKS